ncbi:MAG: 4-alpha-glucanotransferase, partial [Bacillota bacterium]
FRNILLDYFRGEKDAELVHLALNTLFENYPLPHFYSTMNLLGSHDVKRILTELIPDEIPDDVKSDKKNIGFKRLKQLILWQMTFPGVPSIYYGDEAGLEGEEDPDNRRTYPWGKENQDLIRWYKEKIYLRNNYDMFRTGEWISLKFDNNIYGYLRKIENNSDVFSEEKENNTALVLFNPDINNSRQISLDLSKWFHNTVFDFLENKKINIKSGAENKLTLPPLTGKVVLDKKWPEKILNQRKAGILLHISSLPSDYGIGDLGKNAYKFIDFLEKSQQTYWQILPFTPPAKENSPYRSFSAFAGNPLLIDPEFLVKKGWLKPAELEENFQFNHHNVDFSLVKKYKHKILKKAFSRFNKRKNNEKFNRFIKENRYWLEDYSLFMALYGHFGGKNWTKWPDEIANYNKKAVEKYETLLKEEINFHNFLQYIFFEQWTELKKYAHKKGIKIIGDIPIFVDHNSSEVWANPHLFKLNSEGKPEKVAGVPPDAFSETGQKWGNPVYDWNNMAQEKFQWWLNRFAWMEKLVDEVRLDHFRGFEAYWEIPAESETAINGEWKRAPGKEFFDTVKSKLKKLSIIAEDLGYITPEVEELKIINDFPGMKILQFMISPEIDQDLSLPYHQYKNYVYTGTHDNKTLWQWYQDYQKNESESSFKKFEYFNLTRKDVCWNFIEKVFSSPALKAIIPLQDFLGLGKEGRMNTPGTSRDNWDWRFSWKMIPENMSSELKQLTEKHERN